MIKTAFPALLTIAQVLLPASVAGGQSIEAARTAHAEGRFLEAAELGEALKTSEGYALAAEAVTIHGYYVAESDEKEAQFERAMQLAQQAVRADPANPEAHLQSAHAMGRHGQTIGALKAVSKGYAEKVREALENALRLDPGMASAQLSLATWHAEVVNGVGAFMAGAVYGATKKKALAHCQRALELAPDEKVVLVECGLGLLLLDDDRNREPARDLLVRALELPSKDAFDRILHQRTVEKLAALDARESRARRTGSRESAGR